MTKISPTQRYSDSFDPDEQKVAEGLIQDELAKLVHYSIQNEHTAMDPDLGAMISRKILRMTLAQFRPDLFRKENT